MARASANAPGVISRRACYLRKQVGDKIEYIRMPIDEVTYNWQAGDVVVRLQPVGQRKLNSADVPNFNLANEKERGGQYSGIRFFDPEEAAKLKLQYGSFR